MQCSKECVNTMTSFEKQRSKTLPCACKRLKVKGLNSSDYITAWMKEHQKEVELQKR